MIFNSIDIMKPDPFSEEVDSIQGMEKRRKHGEAKAMNFSPPPHPAKAGDGASIEVSKRPRGRPPGSRNKPKPPVVITKEVEPSSAMRPHVLEIPGGQDIVDCLARFSRRRRIGVCVLTVTGSVFNVTIRQPGAEAAIVFHGRFEILSISATFMQPEMTVLSLPSPVGGRMTISLAGTQGQIIGGTVVGPLMAAGVVIVVAATFLNPTFHRLPLEEDASVSVSGSDAAPEVAEKQYHEEERQRYIHNFHLQRQHSSPSPPQPAASAAAESGGMAIYGAHFSPEIVWPPGGRLPHQPY